MQGTYQKHNRPDRPLDVDTMVPIDRQQASLRADDGEVDECTVVVHDLLDVFPAVRQEPIDLPW